MKTTTHSRLRRLFPVLASTTAVFVLLVAGLPFFVDVDKYRPEIIKLVNSKINGQVELGKIQLSLWGHLGLTVEHADLTDFQKKPILNVGKFSLSLPLMSVVTGHPTVAIKLIAPKIVVERSPQGEWNVLKLMKQSGVESQTQKPSQEQAAGGKPLPQWVSRATVSLDMSHAELEVSDLKSQSKYQLKSLSFKSEKIGWENLPAFKLAGVLNTSMGSLGSLQGPFVIHGDRGNGGLALEADFTAVAMSLGQIFEKTDKIPAKVKLTLSQDPAEWKVSEGLVTFHTAILNFEGRVGRESSGEASSHLQLRADTPGIKLDTWSQLLPGLEKSMLQGTIKLGIQASGSLEHPSGEIAGSLEGVRYKGQYFKEALDISGNVKAHMDSIEKLNMQFSAPGFDLRLFSQVASFDKPRISLRVESNEMDLDQLFDWESMRKEAAIKLEQNGPKAKETGGNAVKVPDYDAPLAWVNKNELVKKATGDITFNGKMLKFYNVRLEPLRGKFILKNLDLSGGVDEANLWKGKVKATGEVMLSGDRPKYRFQGQLNSLDLQEAVASQMELFKNTATGLLSGEIQGEGESFNPVLAKKNLVAQGKMRIRPAKLTSVDINRMLSDGLKESMAKLGDKVPALRGKQLNTAPVSSDFKQITSSFAIKDGEFNAPDFFAEGEPQKGVDIRGYTKVGLIDYVLNADWEVSDPYNLLKVKDLDLEEGGLKVNSVLVEKGKPFKLPIRVRGTLLSPQFDYALIPEFLAKTAVNNLAGAAQEKAQAEVKRKAQEEVKKLSDQAPKPIQNILKGIFK